MCMLLVCTLFAPHTKLVQWLGGGQHPLICFLQGLTSSEAACVV